MTSSAPDAVLSTPDPRRATAAAVPFTPGSDLAPGASGARSAARRPGLDILRGVAIGLVMVRHAFPTVFPNGGIVGVVLFFALSGYLITGILNTEVERRGRVAYWRFYRNRFLRLYPALTTLVLVFGVVTIVVNPIDDRRTVFRSAWGAMTYTTDLWWAGVSGALGHLWTLAIEEQFYLVWPVILVLALRRRIVPWLLVGGVVLLTALNAWVIQLHSPRVLGVYYLPSSWAVTLLIGAAGYLLRTHLRRATAGWRGHLIAVLALGVVAYLTFLPEGKNEPLMYLVGGPVIALCSVALVLELEKWTTTPIWLEPLRALGLISYAAYLWNYLIVRWLHSPDLGKFDLPLQFLSIGLTILAATLSWWLVEKPFASIRKRFDAKDRVRYATSTTRDPSDPAPSDPAPSDPAPSDPAQSHLAPVTAGPADAGHPADDRSTVSASAPR